MESRSLQLFPTLVKQFREIITEKERLEIIEILKKHNTSDDGLVKGGKSSFNVEYNILSFLGDELSQKIQKMFDEYAQEAGVHQVKIVQSWYSIQDVGGILKEHRHSNSFLSAAFYINVDSFSSPLHLVNPNPMIPAIWNGNITYGTPYNFYAHTFRPVNGDLIIFPSWIEHGSQGMSNQTVDRTVISINALHKNN